MDKYKFMIIILSLSLFLAPRAQAQPEAGSGIRKKARAPTITITKLDVNDTKLELSWEIRNDSAQDVWILMGLGGSGANTSAFMDKDNQTLLIRRRLDLPAKPKLMSFPTCNGRYVRLRASQTLTELVSLTIPVHPEHGFAGGRKARGIEHAMRLTIEFGYYISDLPGMVRRILEEDEKNPRIIPAVDPYYTNSISGWFKGLRGFNNLNELVRSRDDEVLIPFTSQAFTGEQVLRLTVDDLQIPYEEKRHTSKRYPPDLTPCTRIEIQYQPSMLEYFFPYAGQQSLLSPAEKEYLQSLKAFVSKDQKHLKALAHEVSSLSFIGTKRGTITAPRMAHIACYRDDKRLASFTTYLSEWGGNFMRTGEMHRFRCLGGLRMASGGRHTR